MLVTVLGFANDVPFGTKLTLTKMNGKSIEGTNIFLTIDNEKQTIFGKSGCNNFNLSYTPKPNKETCIKTGQSVGTLMACDEATMNLEHKFLNTIQNKKFKIKTKGDKVQFKNWWGKTILEFDVQTNESVWNFIEKNDWKLIMMNNVGKDYGKTSIKFDTQENRVSGNAGCNSFSGGYKVEGEYISFTMLGTTKMLCDEESNQTERDFITILSGKKLRFDVADQTLNLYDGNRMVMVFGVVR